MLNWHHMIKCVELPFVVWHKLQSLVEETNLTHIWKTSTTHTYISFLLESNRRLSEKRVKHILFDISFKGRSSVIVRQQDVGVWLTPQAGHMMRMLTSAAAGTFSLGFTPTAAEPAAEPTPVSRTTRSMKQDCGSAPPMGRRWKLTLLNNAFSLCDLLFLCFHNCCAPIYSRRMWISGTSLLTIQLPER